ncbi:MAG: tRNA (adenosine(37)-N6)-dimethylallyltransferase MiaA [Acholeplasmataceae bacterium]|jgi:tRNA dimethylallyltransferase|nr:tRNA (adenosine(37)-N6)-dimethylallyltransferase MiaA [Acholeplasmataceae bacterium]
MKKVVVIVGPTAVGKTSISVEIAEHFGSEIISGDSVQVYRGLDIGSAKIKPAQARGIKHHLLDILDLDESYDVAKFQKDTRELIAKIKHPLIVGGTGLYIKAALDDYDFSSSSRRLLFEETYHSFSNEELHRALAEQDYEASLKIHPNNRRRVLRALSLSLDKGTKKTANKDNPIYDYLIFYLSLPRKVLYKRIDARVDVMIRKGLIEEAAILYEKGYDLNIIGYKQLNQYFAGNIKLETAINDIKRATRRYAKRQETWFKNQMTTTLIDMSNYEIAKGKMIKKIGQFWKTK